MSAWPTLADGSDTPEVPELLTRCRDLALGIGQNLEACETQLESDRRVCSRRVELESSAAKAAAEIRLGSAKERIKILQRALEASEERADREVWEHPGWWLTGGLAVGSLATVVATYASIWAVGQLRPAIPPAE